MSVRPCSNKPEAGNEGEDEHGCECVSVCGHGSLHTGSQSGG